MTEPVKPYLRNYMSSLLELVRQALDAGDTAEGIAKRAKLHGDTVRRVVEGLSIRKESEEKLLRVLRLHDGDSDRTVSPLVSRQMAWAGAQLEDFLREYTARIAEALGASMAAAIRNPPTVDPKEEAAEASRLAKLARDSETAEERQARQPRRRQG